MTFVVLSGMDVVRPMHLVQSGAAPRVRREVDVRDTVVSNLFLLHHRRLVGLASLQLERMTRLELATSTLDIDGGQSVALRAATSGRP